MTATDVSSNSNSIASTEISRREWAGYDPTQVRTLVQNGWQNAQTYASNSFNAATSALAGIQAAIAALSGIPTIDTTLATIGQVATTLTRFSESFPAASVSIPFTDQNYSSAEYTHVIQQLDQWVQGSYTGLPPAIEQALWDRGRAREVVSSSKKSQEVLRQFAARGFSKPPGALATQLLDAAQEAQDNDVTLSRDIAVKQADLMQSNRRFAFEQAANIQKALMDYMQGKMQRAAEIARTLAQLQVEVDAHMAQAYGARANYAGQLNGAEAQLTRAATDLQIAQGNLRIEASKANIMALVEKARMTVEAIRAMAQISGQLSASALAAVNLSAGLHDSTGSTISISDARSRSVSVGIGSQSNRQENYTP